MDRAFGGEPTVGAHAAHPAERAHTAAHAKGCAGEEPALAVELGDVGHLPEAAMLGRRAALEKDGAVVAPATVLPPMECAAAYTVLAAAYDDILLTADFEVERVTEVAETTRRRAVDNHTLFLPAVELVVGGTGLNDACLGIVHTGIDDVRCAVCPFVGAAAPASL